MKKFMPSFIAGLACVFAGFILGMQHRGCGPKPEPRVLSHIERDTVYEIRQLPPLVVNRAVAKVKFLRDTVRQVVSDTSAPNAVLPIPPFIATMDTTIAGDTIAARFEAPEMLFSIVLRRKPDSVATINTVVTLTVEKSRPWWMDVLTHAGAGAIGYGLGGMGR